MCLICFPVGVIAYSADDFIFSVWGNNAVRRSTDGVVRTIAGSRTGRAGDTGDAESAVDVLLAGVAHLSFDADRSGYYFAGLWAGEGGVVLAKAPLFEFFQGEPCRLLR